MGALLDGILFTTATISQTEFRDHTGDGCQIGKKRVRKRTGHRDLGQSTHGQTQFVGFTEGHGGYSEMSTDDSQGAHWSATAASRS